MNIVKHALKILMRLIRILFAAAVYFLLAAIFTVLNTAVKMDANIRIPTTRTRQSGNGTTKCHSINPIMVIIRTIILTICNFFMRDDSPS